MLICKLAPIEFEQYFIFGIQFLFSPYSQIISSVISLVMPMHNYQKKPTSLDDTMNPLPFCILLLLLAFLLALIYGISDLLLCLSVCVCVCDFFYILHHKMPNHWWLNDCRIVANKQTKKIWLTDLIKSYNHYIRYICYCCSHLNHSLGFLLLLLFLSIEQTSTYCME